MALFEGINVGDSDYRPSSPVEVGRRGLRLLRRLPPELGLLLRQAREQGLNVQFMGPEGTANQDLVAIAGPAIDGLLVTLPSDFTSCLAMKVVRRSRTPSATPTARSRCLPMPRCNRWPEKHQRGGRRPRQG